MSGNEFLSSFHRLEVVVIDCLVLHILFELTLAVETVGIVVFVYRRWNALCRMVGLTFEN